MNAGNDLEARRFNNQLVTQIAQYDSDIEFRADSWNVANAQAIEQSNVAWRRKQNTLDTAAQNASNQQAAQFAYGLTAAEQSFIWQSLRDTAAFNQSTKQNTSDRAMQIMSSLYGNEEAMSKPSRFTKLSNNLEKIIFGTTI